MKHNATLPDPTVCALRDKPHASMRVRSWKDRIHAPLCGSLLVATLLRLGAASPEMASGTLGDQLITAGSRSTVQIKRLAGGGVPQNELNWWHYQVLLNNPDLEVLLRYLNTDKGWAIGPVLPQGFKYTASRQNLDRMIKSVSTSGFGMNSTIQVKEGGANLGTRNTSRYIFELEGTRRSGKPYTAVVICGRDLNSGYYWTRVAVREFKDGNVLNIHEYANRGGKPTRTSNKKGETFLLRAFNMAGGQNQQGFVYKTLPAMQRSSSLFSQTRTFLVSDPNASVNELSSATVTVQVAADEGWWSKIKTKFLEQIQKAVEKLFQKLLSLLKAYIDDHYKEIIKVVGSYIQSSLNDVLNIINDLFSWLKGLLGF